MMLKIFYRFLVSLAAIASFILMIFGGFTLSISSEPQLSINLLELTLFGIMTYVFTKEAKR